MIKRKTVQVGVGLLVGVCAGSVLWHGDVWSRLTARISGSEGLVVPAVRDPAHDLRGTVPLSPSPDQGVALQSGPYALLDQITWLSSGPRSAVRDAELHATISQLAMVDPSEAVQVVLQVRLGQDFLLQVFQPWFASDPDSALNELGGLPAGPEWLAIALELVEPLQSVEAVARVASALPPARGQALRLRVIEALAERNIGASIANALAFDSHTSRVAALRRVGVVAAGYNPRMALDFASQIPYEFQRKAYLEQVYNVWASEDAVTMFGYLERADQSGVVLSAEALGRLASTDPERLLQVLHRWPSETRRAAQLAAMDVFITDDPDRAYAFAAELPSTRDRDGLLLEIVARHAPSDPKGALSSILATPGYLPSRAVHEALLIAAGEDVQYALEKAADTLVSGRDLSFAAGRMAAVLSVAIAQGFTEVSAAVDAVANHPDARVRLQLNGAGRRADWGILGQWAEHDPVAAADWAMRHTSQVSAGMMEYLGAQLAERSSVHAEQFLYNLPAEQRGYWVVGVARGLAATSIDAAVEWLQPTVGAPVYATALEGVLNVVAATDPTAAAHVIDSNVPEAPPILVLNLAREWALDEPEVAGDWLVRSPAIDDGTRIQVLRDVISAWAEYDSVGAERWMRNQPEGPLRDSSLDAIVRGAAVTGALDPRLLRDFSSDRAREQALADAMNEFRQSDPDLGRLLMDQYITDPLLRDLAERRLEGLGPPSPPVRVIDGVMVR